MAVRRFISRSEAETERIGAELVAASAGDLLVLLEGDLGSGKTVLVRGIGTAVGVDRREIQSPTYTLIHEHEGVSARLFHVDLYRLEGDEIHALGLEQILAQKGIKTIEWAERLCAAGIAVGEATRIRCRRIGAGQRQFEIDTIGAHR